MSMTRRHKTDTSDLEALLLELETMPRLDFMNGVKRVVNNVVQARIVSHADIVTHVKKSSMQIKDYRVLGRCR